MAEITQRLGFEASSAISTLNSLNTALRSVNTSLRAMNKATAANNLGKVSGNLNSANASAQSAAVGIKKFNTAVTTTATKASKATRSLTVGFGTLGRVVATQLVVRGIGATIRAMGDASESFAKFEEDTLRISNIADEGAGSVDSLRDSFSELSVQTGRSIEEVTSAGMEALQNDLGTTAETMDLLAGSAQDLAQATGTDLTSAINSISSVLKAFDQPISKSADIADTFFTAFDKGRIKMSELESRLGTVLPLVKVLGGNFDEAAGSVAALTLSGLNSQTAMTQLRNLLNKLVKPTDAMRKSFKDLGVASGKELLEKFGGLNGALRALSDNVNGDEEALAKMFNTIRGSLGVFNLLSGEGKKVAVVMDAIADNTGDVKEAADNVRSSLSFLNKQQTEQLNKEIRKLGPALLEIELFASSMALNFVTGLKEVGKEMDILTKKARTTFPAILDLFDKIITSSSDQIQNSRLKQIATEAEAAKKALSGVNERISKAGADQRAGSGLTGQGKESFDQNSRAIEQTIKTQALLNSQLAFTQKQIDINTVAQQNFAAAAKNASNVGLLGGQAELEAQQAAVASAEQLQHLSEAAATADTAKIGRIKEVLNTQIDQVEAAAAAAQAEGNLNKNLVANQRGQIEVTKQNILAREKQIKLEASLAEQVQTLELLKQDAVRVTAFVMETEIQKASEAAGNSIKAIPDPVLDATQAVLEMERLTAVALKAAAAVRAAQAGGNANATQVVNPFFQHQGGKPAYRANGGRGSDTQPAMLGKDEFVMNARSSKQFFPQMSAMNAGQKPAFREQGGSVTNIGDVNVNVTGGAGSENPDAQGRQIANSLRRELRRKTSAL